MKEELKNGVFKAIKDENEYLIRVTGIYPFLTITHCINLRGFVETGSVKNNTQVRKEILAKPEDFKFQKLVFDEDIPNLLVGRKTLSAFQYTLKNKSYWDNCAEKLTPTQLIIRMKTELNVTLDEAKEICRANGYPT